MQTVLISGAAMAGPTLTYWLKCGVYARTAVERAPALRRVGYVIDLRRRGDEIADSTSAA